MKRIVAVALITLAAATGCVTQEPPGQEFTEDLGNDFETEDYLNP